MRRYKEAQKCFTIPDTFVRRCGVDFHPKTAAEVNKIRERVRHKIIEEEGTYHFELIRKKFKETNEKLGVSKHLVLEYGSYTSTVEVRESSGKERGLFLKNHVKTGDLLLSEKALAFAQVLNFENENWIIHVSMDARLPAIGVHGLLVGDLIQKSKKNATVLKEFLELDSGGYVALAVTAVDGEPVIDTKVMILFPLFSSKIGRAHV